MNAPPAIMSTAEHKRKQTRIVKCLQWSSKGKQIRHTPNRNPLKTTKELSNAPSLNERLPNKKADETQSALSKLKLEKEGER